MELTIGKQDFLRGLARTHGVADRKSSMPILSNILLTTEGTDRLRLAATDLYLGVTALVSAQVGSGGTVAVAARTLFDIVKNLPDGEVSWKLSDSHAVELSCGKVRYRIPAMPGEDFPPLPNPGDADFAHLDAALLAELISQAAPFSRVSLRRASRFWRWWASGAFMDLRYMTLALLPVHLSAPFCTRCTLCAPTGLRMTSSEG